jgi:hypothetical protein
LPAETNECGKGIASNEVDSSLERSIATNAPSVSLVVSTVEKNNVAVEEPQEISYQAAVERAAQASSKELVSVEQSIITDEGVPASSVAGIVEDKNTPVDELHEISDRTEIDVEKDYVEQKSNSNDVALVITVAGKAPLVVDEAQIGIFAVDECPEIQASKGVDSAIDNGSLFRALYHGRQYICCWEG